MSEKSKIPTINIIKKRKPEKPHETHEEPKAREEPEREEPEKAEPREEPESGEDSSPSGRAFKSLVDDAGELLEDPKKFVKDKIIGLVTDGIVRNAKLDDTRQRIATNLQLAESKSGRYSTPAMVLHDAAGAMEQLQQNSVKLGLDDDKLNDLYASNIVAMANAGIHDPDQQVDIISRLNKAAAVQQTSDHDTKADTARIVRGDIQGTYIEDRLKAQNITSRDAKRAAEAGNLGSILQQALPSVEQGSSQQTLNSEVNSLEGVVDSAETQAMNPAYQGLKELLSGASEFSDAGSSDSSSKTGDDADQDARSANETAVKRLERSMQDAPATFGDHSDRIYRKIQRNAVHGDVERDGKIEDLAKEEDKKLAAAGSERKRRDIRQRYAEQDAGIRRHYERNQTEDQINGESEIIQNAGDRIADAHKVRDTARETAGYSALKAGRHEEEAKALGVPLDGDLNARLSEWLSKDASMQAIVTGVGQRGALGGFSIPQPSPKVQALSDLIDARRDAQSDRETADKAEKLSNEAEKWFGDQINIHQKNGISFRGNSRIHHIRGSRKRVRRKNPAGTVPGWRSSIA